MKVGGYISQGLSKKYTMHSTLLCRDYFVKEPFIGIGRDYRIQQGMLRLPDRRNSRELIVSPYLNRGKRNAVIRAKVKRGFPIVVLIIRPLLELH